MSDQHIATAVPEVGSRVGDYVLDSIVGAGGVGVVFSAVGPDGDRVALKLVKPKHAVDETFRRRFHREVRIGQTVHHPHIVRVLETGEHEGLPYFTARYVEGGSLAERLERDPRLGIETTVSICSQVADGLGALWDAGMVHRDVKPANILLDRDNNAHLTDFGFAKISEASLLTLPGQALGSMDYMAPEQIRGETVTAATDVYALGCVIFQCVEGRAPFSDRAGVRVLYAHLTDEPPSLSSRDDLPPAFAEAVLTALRKDPAERPQRATDYARMLSQAARV